jgi:hypothetical protein
MESALYTFLPQTRDLQTTLLILLGAGLATVAFSIFLLYRPQVLANRLLQLLLPMSLFFVGIISLAAAAINGLALLRLYPIQLFAKSMLIQGKNVAYSNINNAYILKEQEISPLTSEARSTQISFLAIEKSDGIVVRFSEEYYPVREILGEMRQIISGNRVAPKVR